MTDDKKKLGLRDDDSKKRRSWFGTWNNYPEDWEEFFEDCEAVYYCAGKEVCPTTGTKHIQFWCHWKNGRTMKGVKKLFSSKIHLEPLKGTPEEATIYCKKDGDYIEEGEIPHQGERVDLTEIRDMIVNRTPEIDIMMNHFGLWSRHYKSFERARALIENRIHRKKPKVIWLWGASGLGKSKYAKDVHGEDNVFIKSCNDRWWDLYESERHIAVVIDDMPPFVANSSKYPDWSTWKNMCDWHDFRIEVKHGYRLLLAEYIYITTSWNPHELWREGSNKEKELTRRVDEFIKLGEIDSDEDD